MYKVLLGGYEHLVPKETQASSTDEIVDKGRGTAESPSHENYFSLRLANEGTGPKLCQTILSKNQGAEKSSLAGSA